MGPHLPGSPQSLKPQPKPPGFLLMAEVPPAPASRLPGRRTLGGQRPPWLLGVPPENKGPSLSGGICGEDPSGSCRLSSGGKQ